MYRGVASVKKHHEAEATAPTPVAPTGIVSFYRHCARRCETAARNAPNQKTRAELSRMISVWHELAAEHEQLLREGRNLDFRDNHSLKGWM